MTMVHIASEVRGYDFYTTLLFLVEEDLSSVDDEPEPPKVKKVLRFGRLFAVQLKST